MMKTFSIGGIHPSDKKISKDCKIEVLPLPSKVFVSMAQHLGAPATPVVKAGDIVKVGQVIAEPAGFISAFVHSPVSGTVKSVGPRKDLAGNNMVHVEIDVEGDEWAEGIDISPEIITSIPEDNKAILDKIKMNGVVGLGGATFPTHVKLCPPPGKKADCLILNGAECEPYLTSDYRIMLERSKEIIIGAAIMKQVLGGCPAVIGIEENKPEAIKVMKESLAELQTSAKGYEGISVMSLKKKYPQGGEKQLNYKFRIGMPLSYIAEVAGGVPEQAAKIISGGPMMGKAIANLDATTVKGSSSLLYLTAEQTVRGVESACIRCGKCAEACPMGLEPFLLQKYARNSMMDELEENAIQDCIECGCCLYSCPANIPLLDIIRIANGDVIRIIRGRGVKN